MVKHKEILQQNLPAWDLKDLYFSPKDPALLHDVEYVTSFSRAFANEYRGKLKRTNGIRIAEAIKQYEVIQEKIGKISSYAQLVYATNMVDEEISRFYQDTMEKVNEVTTDLVFFTLELNCIDDEELAEELKRVRELRHYEPWLRDIREFRKYQLSDEVEQALHERSVVGQQAWSRLFDETLARLKFPFRNEEFTCAEILNKLSSHHSEDRKEAAKSVGKVFKENIRTFVFITNTLAKDKEIDDRLRKFPRPISARNVANLIEDEVVDALIHSVKASYPILSHRYYKLKAKWFGVDALNYWDRNAPLPEESSREIPWEEAKSMVLSAYEAFSPELASIGKKFFDNNWIDVPPRPGKDSGAFAHPTVPSAHPYLLLNYQGKVRDVMTLAHELGHGVHQCLAAGNGALMADTPLTLAETASVFGEQLTFQSLLANEADPKRKKALLAGKVEDMLNTVVRQIAFCEFERQVHDERKKSELSEERIGEIWMSVQQESLGKGIRFEPEYRYYWAYISHFIHSPFYVYSYAFGDCLVNSLYAVYQEKPQGFAERYLQMLRAGGSKRYNELLQPFGLDAKNPDFWQKGLSVISGFIDQLEKM